MMDQKYETVKGRENNEERKKKISDFTLWRIS
jgi:cysteinyl-tRNA synthetase